MTEPNARRVAVLVLPDILSAELAIAAHTFDIDILTATTPSISGEERLAATSSGFSGCKS
jgi:hypothetical protein